MEKKKSFRKKLSQQNSGSKAQSLGFLFIINQHITISMFILRMLI